MKNKVILFYKRPKRIQENAEWQTKDYTYFYSAFSTAVDSALRLANEGYAIRIEINGISVIEWTENFIRNNYKI